MNAASWLVAGLLATLALSGMLSLAYGLRFTRFSFPWLLGSLVTPDRDRARVFGTVAHVANGMAFSLAYVGLFEWWERSGWLLGALMGAAHAAVLLLILTPLLPGIHPRMASESADATVVRGLEPPGFLGLHYGAQTPVALIAAHVVYGAILGALYAP